MFKIFFEKTTFSRENSQKFSCQSQLAGVLHLETWNVCRIYVVTDEAIEVERQREVQSPINLEEKHASTREREEEINASYDLDSLLRSLDTSSAYEMSDIEVLQVHT